MTAHKHKRVQITGVPVGALSSLGKGSNADQKLENKFSGRLNKFMMPALSKYTSDIFGGLLGDDGRGFIKSLKKRTNQRVFSTSTEGGIFEAGLQLASRKASNFSGDDMARFDFEESGNINPALKDAFFPGQNVLRADAKRSDSAENIQSLIAKSFGTPTTAKAWRSAMSGSMSKWKQARAKRAAGGFVPNFSGLGAAIGREKAAGVPSSAIRINSSPRFQSGSNPAGLAVTNTMDEPRGLRDVPNFADPDIMGRSLSTGRLSEFDKYMRSMGGPSTGMAQLNTALTGAADDWANNKLKTGEFNDKVKKITGTLGISDAEQKKIIKETKKYGKAIRPGSGMGGMMAIMAVPMIAGGIEQAVGGRAGSAISGTATGGVMGGVMGGAALGTLTTPVIGTIIGAVVGGLAGLATSLSSTAESASAVATALMEMQASTERHIKGGAGLMVATEQIKEAATLEDLNTATNAAAAAMRGISDVNLREDLEGAGTDINKMREVMKAFAEEQGKLLSIGSAKKSMMGMQENEVIGEMMRDERAGKMGGDLVSATDKKGKYYRAGKATFTPLAEMFLEFGAQQDEIDAFVNEVGAVMGKKLGGKQSDANIFSSAAKGEFSDKEITEILQKTMGEKITDPAILKNIATAIESGLDPDMWRNDAEKESAIFFMTFFKELFKDKFSVRGARALANNARMKDAGNYTKAWQALLTRVNTTILEYTEDLIKMAEEAAVRKATVSARQGFLSFRGGAANAAEHRQAGATDIAQRRSGLDKSLFTAQKASIMTVLKGMFKDQTSLGKAEQSILYGPQGFEGGGFKAGMESLKAQKPDTGDQVTPFINLIKNLEDAWREGNAVINKDEKVQQIKMKALEIRARIVEQEHKNAVSQAENIHASRMNLGRERGDTSMRIAEIKRGVEAPGALNFLTSAQRLSRTQGADTAVFNEERQLREKEAIASAKEKLIEIQNQANVQKMTVQLVESNFDLKKSIDILNTTMSSPRPVAATGAASGDGTPASAGAEGGGLKGAIDWVTDWAEGNQFAKRIALGSQRQDLGKLKQGRVQLSDINKGEMSRAFAKEGNLFPKFETMSPEQRKEGALKMLDPETYWGKMTSPKEKEVISQYLKDEEAIAKLTKEIKEMVDTIKPVVVKGLPASSIPKGGAPAPLSSFTNSVSTEKGIGFPGLEPQGLSLTSLEDLNVDQAKTVTMYNEMQTQAFKDRLPLLERQLQIQGQSVRTGMIETAQGDDQNLSLKEREQRWKRIDDLRSKSFKAGVRDSFSQIHSEQEGIFNRLGNELPMQFKNNMVGAIGAAMDKTESLGDALDGVALAFLTTMRNAFLDRTLSGL